MCKVTSPPIGPINFRHRDNCILIFSQCRRLNLNIINMDNTWDTGSCEKLILLNYHVHGGSKKARKIIVGPAEILLFHNRLNLLGLCEVMLR